MSAELQELVFKGSLKAGFSPLVNAAYSIIVIVSFILFVTNLEARDALESRSFLQNSGTIPLGLVKRPARSVSLAEAAFGKYLLQAQQLSLRGGISCVSCHFDNAALRKAHISPGKRKVPPLFNIYLLNSFMSDGRAGSLAAQIAIPLRTEMHVDWGLACKRIESDPEGNRLLQEAKLGPCGSEMIIQTLAAYVGSLVSGNSRFDQFYYGGKPEALTEQEQRGFRVFVRKGHCSTCHLVDGFAAPFTDGGFHSVGVGFVGGEYSDHGRMGVSHQVSADGAFKTPTLRNVALRTCFMHDGSLATLRDVIDYYNRGGTPGARNQDPRIHPLSLAEDEKSDLIAFLEALNSPIQVYVADPQSGASDGGTKVPGPL